MGREAAAGAAHSGTWQIRTLDELVYRAPDLATMEAWAREGRLHPDDRASCGQAPQVRLGDIPQLAQAFAEFEAGDNAPGTSASAGLAPPPAFGSTSHGQAGDAYGVPDALIEAHSDALSALEAVGLGGHELSGKAGSARRGTSSGTAPLRLGETKPREAAAPRAAHGSPSALPNLPPELVRLTPGSGHPVVPASGFGGLALVEPPSEETPPATGDADEIDTAKRLAQHQDEGPTTEAAPELSWSRSLGTSLEPRWVEGEGMSDSSDVLVDEGIVRAHRPWWTQWWAWGIASVGAGVALVVAVPELRAPWSDPPAAAPTQEASAQSVPLEQQVARALHLADPARLTEVEKALGSGDKGQLVHAEVLATRALVYGLWAAVDPAMAADVRRWADNDAKQADSILGQVQPGQLDALRWARVRALTSLAQGKADGVGPTVADDPGLQILAAAMPLLGDPQAKVEASDLQRLTSSAPPSHLGALFLALGQVRAGQWPQAQTTVQGVLGDVPEHPVALALAHQISVAGPGAQTPNGAAQQASPSPPKGPEVGARPAAEEAVAEGRGQDPEVPSGPSKISTAAEVPVREPSGHESADQLIDKGCREAERGRAKLALAYLERALDKRPQDLDARLCMAEAHRKSGATQAALRDYDQVLQRAPKMLSALEGAAKAAAKLGNEDRAMELYRRVLEQDPVNAYARSYIAARE